MVDFKVKFTPTKSFHEKISLPEVRSETQLVRTGRRRSDPKMSVRAYALSLQRIGGRNYRDALRCACAGCDVTSRRDQDTQVPSSREKRASAYNSYGRHCEQNWIKGQRNGIVSRDIDGQRIARTGRGKKRAVRWVDLETHLDSTDTIESRQQRSR